MLINFLKTVPDCRKVRGKKYELYYFLLFTIFAVLSGANGYRGITRFMQAKFTVLKKLFNLTWNHAPRKTMVADTLNSLKTADIETLMRSYSSWLYEQTGVENPHTAIDGKSLNGSYDNMGNKKALQLLSIFCTKNKLILAHEDIDRKTNEIPVVQQIMQELELPSGTLCTLDALHCQKKLLSSQMKNH